MSAYTVIEFGYGICEECDDASGTIEEFAAEAWMEQHNLLHHPQPSDPPVAPCPDCTEGEVDGMMCRRCGGWRLVSEPTDSTKGVSDD